MNDAATSDRPGRSRLRPVVLCVLDGWGYREDSENNAIALAHTPVWDRLMKTCPHALLDASAHAVGLPAGQMGNSEVGHTNIGAGRVVLQDLPRINQAVTSGEIGENSTLLAFIERLKARGGTAHVMGLLSPGGVHSHQDHMAALVNLLAKAGLPVVVHGFLDGRDTPPRSAADFTTRFQDATAGAPGIRFGTISGRYYTMDRDKRWDRTAQAYRALVDAQGTAADSPISAIEAGYAADVSDEFLTPTVIGDYQGMRDGDGILVINFRADRVRQILTALLDPQFDGFDRGRTVAFESALGMTQYSEALDPFIDSLFPQEPIRNVLGAVVAEAGMTQLRIAETEKYAHVTFFLNGGEERTFPGEERILVPSPKVATYDLQPEMSAPELTDRLVGSIEGGGLDLIVVNYANTDMVGHTGDLAAAIKAVETIDTCLGRIDAALAKVGGAMVITADHGNAEQMADPKTGQSHTAHTSNLVPVLLTGEACMSVSLRDGCLADVAPTLLTLLDLTPPAEMTGQSLIGPGEPAFDRAGYSATA